MEQVATRKSLFVVFEGIDGSGKTTLSNRVAGRLRKGGLSVAHVRENGQFASVVTQSIRELARDQRHLAMTPRAELLLAIARDVQLFEEATLPAMRSSDVVLADRFFYTAEVLAEHGRGLPGSTVGQIVRAISCAVEPDLVLLIDVDPHLARARRKVAKVLAPAGRPSSRKGLTGSGMQQRMRAGYRALASRDPERWVVVDNTDASLAEMEATIGDAVLAARQDGVQRGRDLLSSRLTERGTSHVRAGCLDEAVRRFFTWIDQRAVSEPDVAAYLLGGLLGPGIDERRLALAARAPAVVAHGLRGLDDEVSWALRRTLVEVAPGEVASSLRGEELRRAEAMSLRAQLCADAPAEVAVSLIGQDDPEAWLLRAQLHGAEPLAVLASLSGLGSGRAWTWREHLLEKLGGETAAATQYELAAALCRSITGLDHERAWALRHLAATAAPALAIQSLSGMACDRARKWREQHLERAPKAVMRSLAGLTDDHAWELREWAAPSCKEALDSISGFDEPRAWWLRTRCRDLWPSSVVASMGVTAARTATGMELLQYLLAHHGGIALMRGAAIVALGAKAETKEGMERR